MRTVILHYHLFKNAGTSVDRILKRNFGDAWVTAEFENGPNDNTADVERWITNTSSATTFSSHTMKGPLPNINGIRIIPLMLLRDPISRVRSAYRFEREQQSDSWGAQLAKHHEFEGYVRARLDRDQDRQCRNFQTGRLASFCPGPEPELMRAFDGLRQINAAGVVGLVSDFNSAMKLLTKRLNPEFAGFQWGPERANSTIPDSVEMNAELDQLLKLNNRDDLVVMRVLRDLLGKAT